MSGKLINSSGTKMMKKSDKSSVILCRDYLDMDTDEEEFGRQETPEPDEELPPEPEKPIFTEKELETLVQYVKNLTVLSYTDELILSEKSTDVIREYFRNPSHTILIIFYEAPEYKVLLDFPYSPIYGLTYFLRSPWQIFTVDNFMSTVLYGNLNSNMENSILKFLETIYAPIAFNSEEWPKVTKAQVFSNLNKFLTSLTDVTYQPMGLSILYVPQEEIHNYEKSISSSKVSTDTDDDDNDNGVIERLERIARYWIKQIRSALCGVNILFKSEYKTIIDEIEFWNYRFENLNCLKYQLARKTITTILHILEKNKSSSIADFNSLATKMNAMIVEATSNIRFLNLLIDYCGPFDIPNGIDDYATNILLLIRFIGKESEFYNSTDKIEILCRALGTQIIIECKKHIDLEVVFESDPKVGKCMLENCINCCEKFIEIFNQLAIMDRIMEPATFSKIDKKDIFCHVNTFIQRCQDLIEITDTRIVFDKCNDVKMFGGIRAMDHELQYQKIQKLFYKTLDSIKKNRDCILDVSQFTWLDEILNFRRQIKNIDNMMNNLIHNIFDDVENVEEGLEALYSMKRFVIRGYLYKTLYNYWTFIWNLFDEELENVIINIDNQIDTHDELKYFSIDRVTLLRIKKNYLTRQYNMLIDASDWFDDNTFTLIIEKYKRISISLT